MTPILKEKEKEEAAKSWEDEVDKEEDEDHKDQPEPLPEGVTAREGINESSKSSFCLPYVCRYMTILILRATGWYFKACVKEELCSLASTCIH